MAADDTITSLIMARPRLRFRVARQTFPTLTDHEIGRMRRFGEVVNFRDGETLLRPASPAPACSCVSGQIAITLRDGLGHVTPIIDQAPASFWPRSASFRTRRAGRRPCRGNVETLLIPPERLRALWSRKPISGAHHARADPAPRQPDPSGAGGPVLIVRPFLRHGAAADFLVRNGQPPPSARSATDKDAADLIARYSALRADLPLVVCPDGTVLRNPSETTLADGDGHDRQP